MIMLTTMKPVCRCHGELKYTIEDAQLGRTMTEYMCPDRIIDRSAFYSGVHKAFCMFGLPQLRIRKLSAFH